MQNGPFKINQCIFFWATQNKEERDVSKLQKTNNVVYYQNWYQYYRKIILNTKEVIRNNMNNNKILNANSDW